MRFLHARHLHAQRRTGCKQRISQRKQACAVVEGVGGRKRVLIADPVVCSGGAEIFADGLFWSIEGKSCPAKKPVAQQFRAIGNGPQGHVLQHRGIRGELAGDHICRQNALASLRVGNHADVIDC